MLRIGEWIVNPASGEVSRGGETARLEARSMRLLVCLAEHAGEVVSIDELLNQVWSGVNVSPDSVYQAVTSLRRVLGDDPKRPVYIATVPRLGYRMVAAVSLLPDPAVATDIASVPVNRVRPAREGGVLQRVGIALGVALVMVIVFALLFRGKAGDKSLASSSALAAQLQKSIAVLPFLDLTEGMHEEEFADGMTEELIDRLSKIPGLQVPNATSSFYFKGKQIPVGEIAKSLGVAYVLDGSVRKSGTRVRVAARLIRAESGYVVWSDTYDRPFDDILMVQDDIAAEVAKALKKQVTNGERP